MIIDHKQFGITKVSSSHNVFEVLTHLFDQIKGFEKDKEHLLSIGLTKNNRIKFIDLVSIGSLTGTIAEPREIFRMSIHQAASAIILVHNHPSGNLFPSEEDKRLTKKIKEAGKIIGIPLIDHIIFCEDGFYSFADEGMM